MDGTLAWPSLQPHGVEDIRQNNMNYTCSSLDSVCRQNILNRRRNLMSYDDTTYEYPFHPQPANVSNQTLEQYSYLSIEIQLQIRIFPLHLGIFIVLLVSFNINICYWTVLATPHTPFYWGWSGFVADESKQLQIEVKQKVFGNCDTSSNMTRLMRI